MIYIVHVNYDNDVMLKHNALSGVGCIPPQGVWIAGALTKAKLFPLLISLLYMHMMQYV